MTNKFRASTSPSEGWVTNWAVPLAAPVIAFLIQVYWIPVTFVLPLAVVITLCYLALKLSPRTVLVWMVVYVASVLIAAQLRVEPPPTSAAFRPFIRSGFVVAGGITAYLLAVNRIRLHGSNEALFQVISVLPSAVMVTDVSGNILLMNTHCVNLLEGHFNGVSSLSFFAAFTTRETQGREIEDYLKLFESGTNEPVAVTLRTRGEHSLALEVVITIVKSDRNRYAVIVVERSWKLPARKSEAVSLGRASA